MVVGVTMIAMLKPYLFLEKVKLKYILSPSPMTYFTLFHNWLLQTNRCHFNYKKLFTKTSDRFNDSKS